MADERITNSLGEQPVIQGQGEGNPLSQESHRVTEKDIEEFRKATGSCPSQAAQKGRLVADRQGIGALIGLCLGFVWAIIRPFVVGKTSDWRLEFGACFALGMMIANVFSLGPPKKQEPIEFRGCFIGAAIIFGLAAAFVAFLAIMKMS